MPSTYTYLKNRLVQNSAWVSCLYLATDALASHRRDSAAVYILVMSKGDKCDNEQLSHILNLV